MIKNIVKNVKMSILRKILLFNKLTLKDFIFYLSYYNFVIYKRDDFIYFKDDIVPILTFIYNGNFRDKNIGYIGFEDIFKHTYKEVIYMELKSSDFTSCYTKILAKNKHSYKFKLLMEIFYKYYKNRS